MVFEAGHLKVAHTCDSSPLEADAKESWVGSSLEYMVRGLRVAWAMGTKRSGLKTKQK